eukprot:gene3562-2347_t
MEALSRCSVSNAAKKYGRGENEDLIFASECSAIEGVNDAIIYDNNYDDGRMSNSKGNLSMLLDDSPSESDSDDCSFDESMNIATDAPDICPGYDGKLHPGAPLSKE